MLAKFRKTKKSFWQAVFFPTLTGLLTLLVIGFLIFSSLKINKKRTELIQRIEILKREIQILEEKNKQLRAGISQAETEDYLEEVAKEQLGLKKPGEEVVAFIKEKEEKKEEKEEKSFWNPQSWWEWLKSKVK